MTEASDKLVGASVEIAANSPISKIDCAALTSEGIADLLVKAAESVMTHRKLEKWDHVYLLKGAAERLRLLKKEAQTLNQLDVEGPPLQQQEAAPLPSGKSKKMHYDRLRDLAKLGEQRDEAYGSLYLDFGRLLFALLGPQNITSPCDWGRLGNFIILAGKLGRYGKNFANGGHTDSLDDAAVYAQMQAVLDERE